LILAVDLVFADCCSLFVAPDLVATPLMGVAIAAVLAKVPFKRLSAMNGSENRWSMNGAI